MSLSQTAVELGSGGLLHALQTEQDHYARNPNYLDGPEGPPSLGEIWTDPDSSLMRIAFIRSGLADKLRHIIGVLSCPVPDENIEEMYDLCISLLSDIGGELPDSKEAGYYLLVLRKAACDLDAKDTEHMRQFLEAVNFCASKCIELM